VLFGIDETTGRIFENNDITFNGTTNVLTINGGTAWHSGNDGSGSGLDADLLDGVHASNFIRKSGLGNASYYTADDWLEFNASTSKGLFWSNFGNGWHFYPNDTQDMQLRSAATSNVGLQLSTAGTARGYVYANSANDHGLLNNNRTWTLKVDSSGNTFATASHRAPIFYDSDDTAYYVNPTSNSILSSLRLLGDSNVIDLGNSGSEVDINYQQQHSTWQAGVNNNYGNGGFFFYRNGTGYRAGLDISANLFVEGSARAPIFYDKDNTSYYVNPGNTGTSVRIAGQIDTRTQNSTTQNNQLYFGINNGNANGTSNEIGSGITWAPLYTSYTKRSAGILQIGEGNYFRSGLAFYTNNTADVSTDWSERMRLDMDGNLIINQAEISYTSNDNTRLTGSNTNNRLHVNGSIQLTNNGDALVIGRGTSTFLSDEELGFGWGSGWYMTDVTYLRVRNNKSVYSTGDARFSTYYDSNNTAFYVNPAGRSVMGSIDFNEIVAETSQGGRVGRNHAYNTLELQGYGGELMIGSQSTAMSINYRTCNNGTSNHTPSTWYWRAGTSTNWSAHNFGAVTSNGTVTATSDVRAPIFYDTDNTGYYVNPASTGTALNVNGTIAINNGGSSNTHGLKFTGSNSRIWFHGYRTIEGSTDGNNLQVGEGFNYTTILNQTRSPIFYDSDNTGYYVDPASTSVVNQVIATNIEFGDTAGPILSQERDQNLKLQGSTGTDVGISGYSSNGTWSLQLYGHQSGQQGFLKSNWGSWSAYADTSGNWFGTASVRAPIFYDSNNTAYYVNPYGTSRLNEIDFGDSEPTLSGNGRYLNIQTQYGYMRLGSDNSSYAHFHTDRPQFYFGQEIIVDGGGIRMYDSGADVRAYAFYDQVNTAYFVDPSSTNDSIRVAGNIVAYYSDERLKDIEGNIDSPLEKVSQLNGFYYTANKKAQTLGYKDNRQVGVSAQQVEAVMPEVVTDAAIGHGYKTVDYAKLVPLLIEAVKEQQDQIETLKSRLEKLEN